MWSRKEIQFLGQALEALPEEKRRLGWLCLLVTLGHAAVFFFAQITYPPSVATKSSRTHVVIYNSEVGAEGSRANLGFWYTINDPGLLIRPRDLLSPEGLAVPEIKPRWAPFEETSPALLPLSQDFSFLPDQLAPLPRRAAADLVPLPQRFSYTMTSDGDGNNTTQVVWDEGLSQRWSGGIWTLPAASINLLDEARPTVLQLGLDADGVVRHALIESSTGHPSMDLAAVEAVRKLRFKAAPGSPLQWGRVTIFWQFVSAPRD